MSGGWVWALYWEKASFAKAGLSEETEEGEGWWAWCRVVISISVGIGSSAAFRSANGDDNRDGGAV